MFDNETLIGTQTGVPSYSVTILAGVYTQSTNDGVELLTIEDHVDMVDRLTMRIAMSESTPILKQRIGDPVFASLGSGMGGMIFSGQVVALEPTWTTDPGDAMVIRAMDHTHLLRRGRNTRYWPKDNSGSSRIRVSDVVKEVAQECGLTMEVDETSEELEYLLQRNESNMAFLKRMAAKVNYILNVDQHKLTFKKPSFQGSPVSVALGERELRSVSFSMNSAEQVEQVEVRGWDIDTKKEVIGRATITDITPIGDGKKGAEVTRDKFPSKSGPVTAYVTDVPLTAFDKQKEADALAKAELERIARQFCHGKAVLAGNDQVRAGTMIEFSGLSPGYNGRYFVVGTRHIISTRTGYTTEVAFISNTYGGLRPT